MKTMINIKTEKRIKEGAQKLARELGLPLSAVINAYLRDFINNQGINIYRVPKMTLKLEKIISGAESDLRAKKNLSPVLSTTEEIDDYLMTP